MRGAGGGPSGTGGAGQPLECSTPPTPPLIMAQAADRALSPAVKGSDQGGAGDLC